MNVNWSALILQVLQLAAGAAIIATQDDPSLRQVGTVLIGSGIGQSFPQGVRRGPS